MSRSLSVVMFLMFYCIFSKVYTQDYSGSFIFEEKLRHYQVYLPQDLHQNMPVILNLHGYGWSTQEFAEYTKMHEYADTAGFIVVYPEGSYNEYGISGWNTGLRNHPFGVQDTTSNDVGFLSDLVDTINVYHDIDLNRIYSCGHSMGGEMTYRMAIEKDSLFAGYASVAGKLNDISANLNVPSRPLPIIHFHGTNDNVETYDGENDGNLWSVEETIDYWLNKNNCVNQADTTSLPDLHPNDGTTVLKINYRNCAAESHFSFFKIINGGHGWPGCTEGIYQSGKSSRDINASSIIINFFNGKESPPADIAWGKSLETSLNYIPPEGDTLKLNAKIVNPKNHLIDIYAFINGGDTNFKDTIKLFDDGSHSDSYANDNIFGNHKFYSGLEEDFYEIKLRTTDFDKSYTTFLLEYTYFTSAGPLKIDTFTVRHLNDSLISITDLYLKNLGNSKEIPTVTATIISMDSLLNRVTHSQTTFGKIPPGESRKSVQALAYVSKDTNEVHKFILEIKSGGTKYWTDTLVIIPPDPANIIMTEKLPTEYSLHQNYPNPFNPATTIKYSIPKQSNVTLKVFDLLGSEVATLVNKEQLQGNYEVEFGGSELTSGIYFYRLQAGDFVEIKKMILLK